MTQNADYGGRYRPRLLDLFCGAGGAAMGYHRAGFDVVGVDIKPQPRYPFEFHQADALTFDLDGFDVIHASPPCQAFSALSNATGRKADHPNLIPPVRARLSELDCPWVIENVPGAPLSGFTLCGASFGLEIVRHRTFESNVFMLAPPCSHRLGGTTTGQYVSFRHSGKVAPGRTIPPRRAEKEWRRAADVEWTDKQGGRNAVPPAYTEWIGAQLLDALSPNDRLES
jgi:DNA (cytosine-5)-methyltransferase 1